MTDGPPDSSTARENALQVAESAGDAYIGQIARDVHLDALSRRVVRQAFVDGFMTSIESLLALEAKG